MQSDSLKLVKDIRRSMGLGDFGTQCVKLRNRWFLKIEPAVNDPLLDGDGWSISTVPTKKINCLFPYKTTRPSLQFKEFSVEHLIETIWFPGKPDWKPINVTVYDTADYRQLHPAMAWIMRKYNMLEPGRDDASAKNWYHDCCESEYAGQSKQCRQFKVQGVTLELRDGCGGLMELWELHNVWIQNVEFGELDYAGNEYVSCDMTLRYDRAVWVYTNMYQAQQAAVKAFEQEAKQLEDARRAIDEKAAERQKEIDQLKKAQREAEEEQKAKDALEECNKNLDNAQAKEKEARDGLQAARQAAEGIANNPNSTMAEQSQANDSLGKALKDYMDKATKSCNQGKMCESIRGFLNHDPAYAPISYGQMMQNVQGSVDAQSDYQTKANDLMSKFGTTPSFIGSHNVAALADGLDKIGGCASGSSQIAHTKNAGCKLQAANTISDYNLNAQNAASLLQVKYNAMKATLRNFNSSTDEANQAIYEYLTANIDNRYYRQVQPVVSTPPSSPSFDCNTFQQAADQAIAQWNKDKQRIQGPYNAKDTSALLNLLPTSLKPIGDAYRNELKSFDQYGKTLSSATGYDEGAVGTWGKATGDNKDNAGLARQGMRQMYDAAWEYIQADRDYKKSQFYATSAGMTEQEIKDGLAAIDKDSDWLLNRLNVEWEAGKNIEGPPKRSAQGMMSEFARYIQTDKGYFGQNGPLYSLIAKYNSNFFKQFGRE